MNYFETQIPEPPPPPPEKNSHFGTVGGIVITIYALMAAFILFFANTSASGPFGPNYGDVVQVLALPMFITGIITAAVILGFATRTTDKKQPAIIGVLSFLAGFAIAAAVFLGGCFLALMALLSNVHEGGGT